MNKPLFDHIKNQSLSENILIDLLVESVNLNEPDSEDNLPLTVACRTENIPLVRMLLEYGAETVNTIDGSGQSPLMIAYYAKNIELLSLLLWKFSRLVERDPNPSENKEYTQFVSDPESFKSLTEKQLCTLNSDDILKQYPILKKCLSMISYESIAMDIGGGNADNKIECATLRIGTDGKKLEYLQVYNWSHGVGLIVIKWFDGKEWHTLTIDNDVDNPEINPAENISFLKKLASDLQIEAIPFAGLIRFLIVILSRKWQNGHIDEWEDHMLYDILMPEDMQSDNPKFFTIPFKESDL